MLKVDTRKSGPEDTPKAVEAGPLIIGIFINPGQKEVFYDRREMEYVTSDDTYARFLLEEILPEVGKDYNLVDNGAGRAICGMSDGGLCSFTVVWERYDAFSKAISHIGSYTRLRGGSEYPYLIRGTVSVFHPPYYTIVVVAITFKI